MYISEPDDALNCSLELEAALIIPNALAAPFAFEKTNCLSLIGIEKSMGLLKGGGARRTMLKPISISRLRLLLVVHAPIPSYRRQVQK